jgi:hypothetical protein
MRLRMALEQNLNHDGSPSSPRRCDDHDVLQQKDGELPLYIIIRYDDDPP